MTIYDFFTEQVGACDDPVQWIFLAFAVLWIVSDFLHVFFVAVFSNFKK